ncbi:MAG TPA: carboxypeptidase-like regulatory domain-containing protein [Chthonomonadales bacterium]|nr:carboxypeptidase-like regulatory domain-containing protein [Chthonomonadales bacterium]
MTVKRFAIYLFLCVSVVALAGCGSGGGGTPALTSGSRSVISGRAVDRSGAPVRNASVSLSPASSTGRAARAIETTSTDVNGNFTLTGVAAGSYTVSVTTTTNGGAAVTVLVTVTVPASTTVQISVTIGSSSAPPAVTQTGAVFGQITDAATGDAVVGATVVLQSRGSGIPPLRAVTDASGNFQFSTVPVGLWIVTVKGEQIESTSRTLVEVQAGASSEADLTVALNSGSD